MSAAVHTAPAEAADDINNFGEIASRYETVISAVDAALFAIDAGGLLENLPRDETCERDHEAGLVLLGTVQAIIAGLKASPDWSLSWKLGVLSRSMHEMQS